ncbi:MAG: hypothetical protein M3401_17690 [Actinomycetota bacterium]|nr:hypothetical protein [Actinomycetota bacterium]MDQ3722231.1 hypothetical protein [Actinomycetota bacterium]
MADEERDALQGDPDIQSGTTEPDPVNAPTTEDDDGGVGEGTGEGAVTGDATDDNPETDAPEL